MIFFCIDLIDETNYLCLRVFLKRLGRYALPAMFEAEDSKNICCLTVARSVEIVLSAIGLLDFLLFTPCRLMCVRKKLMSYSRLLMFAPSFLPYSISRRSWVTLRCI
jgi:hypothetical protein